MSDIPDQPGFQTETSNQEIRSRWKLSPDADPATVDLAAIDPGNGGWFEAG